MSGLDFSGLAAYAGQYEKKLFSTLVNGLDVARDITVMMNVKNTRKLTKLTVADGARPYTSSENPPTGDLQYSGRDVTANLGKREVLIEPLKFEETWMSELMMAGKKPSEFPFSQYVWDQVFKALGAELNNKTAYNGFDVGDAVLWDNGTVYNPGDYVTFGTDPVNYYKNVTTTAAGESPDTHPAKWQKVNAEAIAVGLGTLIADEITAANLTPVSTGEIDNAAVFAYAQFKKMWRSLPVPYRQMGAVIYCSYNNWDFLFDDFEDKVGKYTDTDQDGNFYLRGTGRRCQIVPATWMGDSGRLICTPKENLIMATDLLSDINKIKVNDQAKLWTVLAGIIFGIGFQIRDLDAIRVNDVA